MSVDDQFFQIVDVVSGGRPYLLDTNKFKELFSNSCIRKNSLFGTFSEL